MSRPLLLAAPIIVLVLVLIAGAGPGEAALAALVTLTIIAAVAFRGASKQARHDFFTSYASTRGLQDGDPELPAAAPLLRMGDRRSGDWNLTGELPGGLNGLLSHYTYEADRDGPEDQPAGKERFTVVIFWLPEITEHVLKLHGEPSSISNLKTGSIGYGAMKPLPLESIDLNRRFSVNFGVSDDEMWLRRLFTPSFIVWMSEHPPDGFCFQLWDGYLCGFVPGHLDSAEELDSLCETTARVGKRLLGEVAE